MKRSNEGQLSVFGGETAADLAVDITSQGYSLVEHGIPEDMVDEAIAAYAEFTDELPDPSLETIESMIPAESDPEKLAKMLDDLIYENDRQGSGPDSWHKYRTNHPMFAKPGGYTNRSLQTRALEIVRGITLDDDPKEYYHYTPSGLRHIEVMHQRYDWGAIPSQVYALHNKLKPIHQLSTQAARQAYYKLEVEHPELVNTFVRPEDLADSPIRLLFYHPGQGDLLAGGHYDKGFGTIQVAESHKGFRARQTGCSKPEQIDAYKANPLTDRHMQLLERASKYGIFFVSGALSDPKEGALPDSPFKPTWHDVVNLPELNQGRQLRGRNCARWAIILFINSEAAGALSKDATHNEFVVNDSEQVA